MVEELETVVEVNPPSAWSLRNGSQLYVTLAVTWTGLPTADDPPGKLMQTWSADGTDEEPPLRSSSVSACCWMYCWSDPDDAGFLFTTAQRAPSFARWVASIH